MQANGTLPALVWHQTLVRMYLKHAGYRFFGVVDIKGFLAAFNTCRHQLLVGQSFITNASAYGSAIRKWPLLLLVWLATAGDEMSEVCRILVSTALSRSRASGCHSHSQASASSWASQSFANALAS